MKRVLFAMLVLSPSGCGTFTCLDVAQDDPKCQPIYGGVRTDINCITSGSEPWERMAWGKVGECTLRTSSVIDLPLSLAADTLALSYAIWWTMKQKDSMPAEKHENDTGAEILGK
jgi:uncharacterized protein YceK